MSNDRHMPYSRKGLEDLAVALGVNSGYLWVDPTYNRLEIKANQQQLTKQLEENGELEEDE